MKIDRHDLKILEILAQNCRTSYASIAAALNVSKDTASYRVRRLEEEKILKQYMLFVDSRTLGFTRYHILVQFQFGRPLGSERMKKLSEHPAVMWINTFIGKFDLQLIVDATDSFQLNAIREDLFKLMGQPIRHYSIMVHLFDYEFTQLNPVLDLGTRFDTSDPQSFGKIVTRRKFPVAKMFRKFAVDRSDREVLKHLANDPKSSITELSEKAKIDRMTVRKKVERMAKAGVILHFSAVPDLGKLGFSTYYLLIRLDQDSEYKEMVKPFQALKNIFYAGSMLGDYDMIAYLNARDPIELNSSIGQFRRALGDRILSYDLLVQDNVYHWRQYTELLYRG